jgi:hypothetical protein
LEQLTQRERFLGKYLLPCSKAEGGHLCRLDSHFYHSFVPWMPIRLSLIGRTLLASLCVVNIDLLTIPVMNDPGPALDPKYEPHALNFLYSLPIVSYHEVLYVPALRGLFFFSLCVALLKPAFIEGWEFGGNRSFASQISFFFIVRLRDFSTKEMSLSVSILD